jgi:hypothetical protein
MPPKRRFTTEYISNLAKAAFHEHGHNLSLHQFSQLSGLSIGIIQLRLGSWLQFKRSLGLDPQPASPTRPTHRRDNILNQLWKLAGTESGITLARFSNRTGISEKTIARHFGSWSKLKREAGLDLNDPTSRCSPDLALLADLHRIGLDLGRFPTPEEYHQLGRASVEKLIQRFGSWEKAEELHNQIMVTTMQRTENSEHRARLMATLLAQLPSRTTPGS